MKKQIIIIGFLLGVSGLYSVHGGAQSPNSFKSFWGKFKTAVINSDKETVSSLSRFPLRMSFGMASVKSKAELMRRYRQVFNEQTNAAACFAKKEPEKDTGSKGYSIACPDAGGNEVVVYSFAYTKTGWRFTGLDNLNE